MAISRVSTYLRKAMAWDRQEFINEVEGCLAPALLHWYKIALTKKNHIGIDQMREHWKDKEVDRWIKATLVYALVHAIKFKGGRRKAYVQAVRNVEGEDHRIQHVARVLVDDYAKKLKSPQGVVHLITAEDTAAFWHYVEESTRGLLD